MGAGVKLPGMGQFNWPSIFNNGTLPECYESSEVYQSTGSRNRPNRARVWAKSMCISYKRYPALVFVGISTAKLGRARFFGGLSPA